VTGYPLHRGQAEVFDAPARHRFVCCGRDWGKTHEALAEILRAATSPRAHALGELCEIVYVGPSYRQVKAIVWKRLKRLVPEHYRRGKPNETELTITLRNGATIRLMGSDNIHVSRGMDIYFLVMDEFAFYHDGVWEIFEGCLRTGQDRALIITTPNGPNHAWNLWQSIKDDAEWATFQRPTWDNPHVEPATVEAKRRRLARNVFAQEYGAEFEAQRGAVYCDFTVSEHVVSGLKLDPALPVVCGQDFNAGHYCCVIGQQRANGALEVVDEVVTTTTLFDHIDNLIRYFDRAGVRWREAVTIYTDASGDFNATSRVTADEKLLRQAGFSTKHDTQNPPIIDRVHALQTQIKAGDGRVRFRISDRCPELRIAFLSQKWSAWGNKPEKKGGHDDILDAACYLNWGLNPLRRTTNTARSL
jgi:hypothetical protein